MRRVLASFIDAVLAAGVAFGGFHFALWSTPCRTEASCAPLAPTIVLCVLAAILLYFGPLVLATGHTLGQLLLHVGDDETEPDGA